MNTARKENYRAENCGVGLPHIAAPVENPRQPRFFTGLWGFSALCVLFYGWSVHASSSLGGSPAGRIDPMLLSQLGCSFDALFKEAQWYRLFSSSLFHANATHLVLNLMCLFAAGRVVEKRYGAGWIFLAWAFIAPLSALAGVCLYNPGVSLLGASGFVCGVISWSLLILYSDQSRERAKKSILITLLAIYMLVSEQSVVVHFAGAMAGVLLALWHPVRQSFHLGTRGVTRFPLHLYSIDQIAVASVVGTPILGALFAAYNYWHLNRKAAVLWTLFGGAIATTLLWLGISSAPLAIALLFPLLSALFLAQFFARKNIGAYQQSTPTRPVSRGWASVQVLLVALCLAGGVLVQHPAAYARGVAVEHKNVKVFYEAEEHKREAKLIANILHRVIRDVKLFAKFSIVKEERVVSLAVNKKLDDERIAYFQSIQASLGLVLKTDALVLELSNQHFQPYERLEAPVIRSGKMVYYRGLATKDDATRLASYSNRLWGVDSVKLLFLSRSAKGVGIKIMRKSALTEKETARWEGVVALFAKELFPSEQIEVELIDRRYRTMSAFRFPHKNSAKSNT